MDPKLFQTNIPQYKIYTLYKPIHLSAISLRRYIKHGKSFNDIIDKY